MHYSNDILCLYLQLKIANDWGVFLYLATLLKDKFAFTGSYALLQS